MNAAAAAAVVFSWVHLEKSWVKRPFLKMPDRQVSDAAVVMAGETA